MNEIDKYYSSLMQDVKARQLSSEDGDTQEQTFTRLALELLADSGETENFDVAFDEKNFGKKGQHKINGYAIADNYETVDLFITILKPDENIQTISKAEIDQAAVRICNFFSKAIYGNYADEIAESSPIFEFADTLARYPELRKNLIRVNAFILTNGLYRGEVPVSKDISSYKFFFRVVDLSYLFQISESSRVPVEIDFDEDGVSVPCLYCPNKSSDYETFLAVFPGACLSNLYERFGSRLLEQNVRAFLQFNGKINKGIRRTINEQPNRFLAYNNGLAITADSIQLDESNRHIKKISNLQIVNGGQTTASIYYTAKKDKAKLDDIYVQAKISVIKNKDEYGEIVSAISKCANTQNKVSNVDLTANNPILVEIEKFSRYLITPVSAGKTMGTYWFFERARGQYKTLRQREGFTKSRLKAFDLKYPACQVFTKADLAKYENSYGEVYYHKGLVIGPNFVCRGAEKNYAQFMEHNLPDKVSKIDNIYYEDLIAKAILFNTAVKRYGTRAQNFCIGNLRSVVVPYTISLLCVLTQGKINLYKIWKNQSLSDELSDLIYELMREVDTFIVHNSQISNYTEWAKKEECWKAVKEHLWKSDLSVIQNDLISENTKPRNSHAFKVYEGAAKEEKSSHELEIIKEIHPLVWKKIAEWGKDGGCLTINQQSVANDIASRLKFGRQINDSLRSAAIEIYEVVLKKNCELLEYE